GEPEEQKRGPVGQGAHRISGGHLVSAESRVLKERTAGENRPEHQRDQARHAVLKKPDVSAHVDGPAVICSKRSTSAPRGIYVRGDGCGRLGGPPRGADLRTVGAGAGQSAG